MDVLRHAGMAVKEPSRSASGMQAPSKRVAKELRVLRLLLWLSLIPCLNWNTVLAVEARTALFKTVPHDILEALRETDRARKSDKDAVVWMVDWVSGNSLPQMCLRDRWRNSNQQRNPPARVPRACAGSTGHTVSSYPTRLPERPWASAAAPTARGLGGCRHMHAVARAAHLDIAASASATEAGDADGVRREGLRRGHGGRGGCMGGCCCGSWRAGRHPGRAWRGECSHQRCLACLCLDVFGCQLSEARAFGRGTAMPGDACGTTCRTSHTPRQRGESGLDTRIWNTVLESVPRQLVHKIWLG